MNILAIECSQPEASLCLSCDGHFLVSTRWTAERNHDQYLFPALAHAINTLGDNKLDYILVGAGPGSYGGVRVALAAAVGISTVKGARTVAIGSWDDLASGSGACVISDARRGGWTMRRPNGTICVLTEEELRQELAQGTVVYTTESEQFMQSRNIQVARYSLIPEAEGLVRSWMTLPPDKQKELETKPAEPIYVRPPHITEAKRKPWEIRR